MTRAIETTGTTNELPDGLSDSYLSLRTLSQYSGISLRSLRRALSDRRHPLPHYRPGGRKVLVRRSEFDRWMRQFKDVMTPIDLDHLIDRTLRELHP
jgi:excisionase family DNA binding protein